jgi:hypothetical protein
MAKYTVYSGVFKCHTCKAEVNSLRLYPDTNEVTWMCPEKHLTSVQLYIKKTKKDYERKERE